MKKKTYGASQEFAYMPEFGFDFSAGVTAVLVKLFHQVVTISTSHPL